MNSYIIDLFGDYFTFLFASTFSLNFALFYQSNLCYCHSRAQFLELSLSLLKFLILFIKLFKYMKIDYFCYRKNNLFGLFMFIGMIFCLQN